MTQSQNPDEFLGREPVWSAEAFVGRKTATSWVADKLGREVPQNCNVIGEPRIGKTSLLYHLYKEKIGLPDQLTGLYVWVRLVELADYQPTSFWRQMVSRLHVAQQDVGMLVEPVAEDVSDARDLFDQLDETIDALVSEHGYRRIVFLIDDFDVLAPELRAQDLDWLRSLATRYRETLAFVICSTDSLVWLSQKVLAADTDEPSQMVSPFANLFHNFSLGLLSREAAAQLCRQAAVSAAGDELCDDDLAFLLSEAGRHPDLLKLATMYLLEAKQWSEPDEAYEDAASDIRFDSAVRWLCTQLFRRRSVEEQRVLLALAQEEDVQDRVIVNRLKRHLGLVEKRNGRVSLFSNAFRYWTRRQTISEPSTETREDTSDDTETEFEDSFEYVPELRLVRLSNGEESRLTPLENRLLVYFLDHVNRVCTTEDLLHNVWGPNKSRAVVEKGVNRLRAKIEHDPRRPRFILSARGEGYLLRMPVD